MKKTPFIIACLLAAALSITGCQQSLTGQFAVNTASAAVGIGQLSQSLDSVNTVDLSPLSADDQQALADIRESLINLRNEIRVQVREAGSITEYLVASSDILWMAAESKRLYHDAKTILSPNIDKFSVRDQRLLKRLDQAAVKVDGSLVKLLGTDGDTGNATQVIRDILSVASMVARTTQ